VRPRRSRAEAQPQRNARRSAVDSSVRRASLCSTVVASDRETVGSGANGQSPRSRIVGRFPVASFPILTRQMWPPEPTVAGSHPAGRARAKFRYAANPSANRSGDVARPGLPAVPTAQAVCRSLRESTGDRGLPHDANGGCALIPGALVRPEIAGALRAATSGPAAVGVRLPPLAARHAACRGLACAVCHRSFPGDPNRRRASGTERASSSGCRERVPPDWAGRILQHAAALSTP
jgi:hypothetical protein